jgi:hypothetical protein
MQGDRQSGYRHSGDLPALFTTETQRAQRKRYAFEFSSLRDLEACNLPYGMPASRRRKTL